MFTSSYLTRPTRSEAQATLDVALGQLTRLLLEAKHLTGAPSTLAALQAIADMRVDERTNPAELAALCIAVARTAVDKAEGRS